MTDCSICGIKLPRDDFEIKHHLINHEHEWIKGLRKKHDISFDKE